MPIVTLGNLDFDAKPLGRLQHVRETYLIDTAGKIVLRKKFGWRCKDQAFEPANAPHKFAKVEPHFWVYQNNFRKQKERDQIDQDSAAAGWRLIKDMGFKSDRALESEINTRFGVRDIPFDLDAAIASEKPFELKIRVHLRFRHFRLENRALAPNLYVMLSVPDHVVFMSKRMHLCTPGGPAPLPKGQKYFRQVAKSYVTSATEHAFDLRKKEIEEELHHANERIKRAKRDKKALEEQLEAIAPKEV